MKNFILIIALNLFTFAANSQTKPATKPVVLKNQIVETACGECQFKMKGKDCELAIRVKGISYFVDGTGIDDHGDAHDKHGFCNAIRKAEVTGTIENGRFKSTAFKLTSDKAIKSKAKS